MLIERERLDILQALSEWLGAYLKKGGQLVFDGDGVLVKGDSLNKIRVSDPGILPALVDLEAKGTRVGVATARGEHFVQWLRGNGMKLEGVSIIEDGQAVINQAGKLEYLVPDKFLQFVGRLRNSLQKKSLGWKETWRETEQFPKTSFCNGNHQWQGRARASFWFRQTGTYSGDLLRLQALFLRPIMDLAEDHGLEIGQDIGLSLVRMRTNNLAMLVVKHNQAEKANGAVFLGGGAVLVEDGFGAIKLGKKIKQAGGGVLGIRGNLDVSTDPGLFLREVADFILDSPQELLEILRMVKNNL